MVLRLDRNHLLLQVLHLTGSLPAELKTLDTLLPTIPAPRVDAKYDSDEEQELDDHLPSNTQLQGITSLLIQQDRTKTFTSQICSKRLSKSMWRRETRDSV